MNQTVIQRTVKMAVLLLVQLVVLNHIHLFGYAMPVVIAFLTMNFNRGTSRIALLLWGFAIGLIYDMCSNTMGLGMASATLLGMIQPFLLKLFTPRDAADDMEPCMRTMGTERYLLYAFSSMLVFHIVYYGLDAFSLRHWPTALLAISGGTVMAFLIVVFAQFLTRKQED